MLRTAASIRSATRLLIATALSLAACSQQPRTDGGNVAAVPALSNRAVAPEPSVAPTLPPARDYAGRWTGVEGMFLAVRPTARAGRFKLTMQYDLDHRQTTDATLDGDALVFERDGTRETLRPTDGKATGLKYLASKRDCLTVKSGEGFCRD